MLDLKHISAFHTEFLLKMELLYTLSIVLRMSSKITSQKKVSSTGVFLKLGLHDLQTLIHVAFGLEGV